jgi:hypothetical protein
MIRNEDKRANRLSELNVIEQVRNLAKSSIVQEAWAERELHLHGWIYGLQDGLIKDLSVIYNSQQDIDEIYRFVTPGAAQKKVSNMKSTTRVSRKPKSKNKNAA